MHINVTMETSKLEKKERNDFVIFSAKWQCRNDYWPLSNTSSAREKIMQKNPLEICTSAKGSLLPPKAWISTAWKKSSKLLLFQRFEQNRFPSWYYIHVVKVGLYSFKEFPDALFQDLSYPVMPGMFDLSLCLFKDTEATALYSSLFNVITFQGKGHMINCFRSKGKTRIATNKTRKRIRDFLTPFVE